MLVNVPQTPGGQQPEEGHTLGSHRGSTAFAFTSRIPWEKTLNPTPKEEENKDQEDKETRKRSPPFVESTVCGKPSQGPLSFRPGADRLRQVLKSTL